MIASIAANIHSPASAKRARHCDATGSLTRPFGQGQRLSQYSVVYDLGFVALRDSPMHRRDDHF
jgi:hypothetical protein